MLFYIVKINDTSAQDTKMIIFGKHDENTLEQINQISVDASRVALMADGHLGYHMPIGGVAAYKDKISVSGVGFDIACGNMAIKTDMTLDNIAGRIDELANDIQSVISFGVGRSNLAKDAPDDHPLFKSDIWNIIPSHHRNKLRAKARDQLGTVGSGNHYVDVFVDEAGFLWIGVHFGSRGLGHTIASSFMAMSQGAEWGAKAECNAILDMNTTIGSDYWDMMTLAGQYAYAGREWVANKVVEIIGANAVMSVHNHHNYAWRETHDDEEYIVVRKGATPAFPGQMGFVGGSMGDISVILEGMDSEISRQAMYSTVHGAGRVMSRTDAKGKTHRKTGEVIREARVTQEMMDTWMREVGVTLRGGGLDESPYVYRRLPEVLADQGDTIRIVEVLRPIIVVMAGANEFDPYKD